MPSARELRCWMLLSVLLLWSIIGGMLWDQILWTRIQSVEDTLQHLQRTVPLLVWGSIGIVLFGAVCVTRLLYSALRKHRPGA